MKSTSEDPTEVRHEVLAEQQAQPRDHDVPIGIPRWDLHQREWPGILMNPVFLDCHCG